MNRLSPEKRSQVVRCLVEGNSIRATVRMTGVAKNTVTKLLVDLGIACSARMDRARRDLPCETLQIDERRLRRRRSSGAPMARRASAKPASAARGFQTEPLPPAEVDLETSLRQLLHEFL